MAADIDITIGAQDKASDILRRVDHQVSKLTSSVGHMADKSNTSTRVINASFASVATAAAGIGAAIGAVKGITAAFDGLLDAAVAYQKQEEAARGMTDAQLQLAASLQKATNVGDEATLALMKQAEFLGISKDLSGEATTAAIGLAEAFGISQTDALKKVSQAMQGNAGALGEYLPAIRNASTEAERMTLVNDAAAKGLLKLQEDSLTTKGVMERSAGAFGDLQEKIGAMVDPILAVVYKGLAVFAETLQVSIMPAVDRVVGGFSSMKPMLESVENGFKTLGVVAGVYLEAAASVAGSFFQTFTGGALGLESTTAGIDAVIKQMAKGFIGTITFMEVGWTNLGKVFELGVDSILLPLETMRADLEHVLTVQVPTYAKWFGENILNISQDYLSATATVFANFADKIGNIWSTLSDFVTSGFEGGMEALSANLGEAMAGSLLEGFQAKTESLPEIAERAITSKERTLGVRMATIGADLAGQFNEKFNERIKALEFDTSAAIEVSAPKLESILSGADALKGVESQLSVSIPQLQADEQRLLTRGRGDDPNAKVAQNTKQIADEFKTLPNRIAEAMRETEPTDRPLSFVQVG
jgi:hypothetical protein